MNYDCIVIYAERDQKFARRLVKQLDKIGIDVWFDESELVVGDIRRRKIADALREVKYAVVILSAHFFKVEKLKRDLESLCLREEDSGELVILPVWHKVTEAEVKKYMPGLAEKRAVCSDGEAKRVAQDLSKAMRMNSPHSDRPFLPEKDIGTIASKLKQHAWKITAVIAILAASASLIKAYEARQALHMVEAENAKLKLNNDELNKHKEAAEKKLHEMTEKQLDYQNELQEMGYPSSPPPSLEIPKRQTRPANLKRLEPDTSENNHANPSFSPAVQLSEQLIPAPDDSSRSMRRFENDGVRIVEFDQVTPKTIPYVPRHDSLEVSKEYKGRDRESVHGIILKHNPAIQDLYKRALKTDSGLTGKLTTRFVIDARGHLIHVEIVDSSGLPPELIGAILSKMLEWKDFGENHEESTKENKYRLTYIFGYQN
jgi:hypothetical protein